jgi:hypothetical protein
VRRSTFDKPRIISCAKLPGLTFRRARINPEKEDIRCK